MFNLARFSLKRNLRRFSTAINRRIEDEGDWFYSSEWWRSGSSNGNTVFRGISDKGNGVVTVLAHPSSKPDKRYWARTENWLEQRYAEIHPGHKANGKFRISGYQWRTLHFNEDTRQSTVKVMTAYREEEPSAVCFMQQPHCLAVPYVKSMISAGLTTISSRDFDLKNAVLGKRKMNVLCIGHGGGSIPLFLATKIQGAVVDIVEIDPTVISASIKAMGFPSFSITTPSGKRATPKPGLTDEILWKGIHERLLLYESDAEKFILESTNLYDIVFIDAYDGEDIFPHKLWDPHSPFLKALGSRLHPDHGTVIVNLHSDADLDIGAFNPFNLCVLPKGNYVSQVCRAYKDALLGNRNSHTGFAYTVSVPWVCNTSLVVCRGLKKSDGISDWDMIFNGLISKSFEVEKLVDLPFSCLQYIKGGFTPVN
ncbi:S-adenosyl-L-methionine-dependent methyltransferase superfamily protein [Abeliophyllum distichum]|uniref:S-adenosyl-L-methionine-dependent methyltransferase superfamily protein n=1 Tax=Abeliophyllum distichum TaxID=126358 RepID=A0ABD1RFG0_9LAMI